MEQEYEVLEESEEEEDSIRMSVSRDGDRSLKIVNKGALPTKIFVKAPDGTTIPFVSVDDIKQKEKRRIKDREASRAASPIPPDNPEGEEGAAEGDASALGPEGAAREESKMEGAGDDEAASGKMRTIASRSSLASRNRTGMDVTAQSFAQDEYQPTEADIFDEFLAQVSFKRTTEIDGYSSTKI